MSLPASSIGASSSVLVVEDSPTQALYLAETLKAAGYGVRVASNGRQALDLMLEERPQVVVSDILMPEMDGYELTRRVRSDPYLRDLPVVLVTSMSDPQDVIRGLECGADGFVLKPLDVHYLVGRIQFILLNRRFSRDVDAELGVRIHFNGQQHFITADRLQILSLLLSTYEAAIQRNNSLSDSQEELRRKTAELEVANRFLDSVIENMPSGIFVLDGEDRRIVRMNRAAEALIGLSRDIAVGRSSSEYFPPEEGARIDAGHRRALVDQEILDVPRYELTAIDGDRKTLHVRRVPVIGPDRRPTHLILMCDDITAQAKAESELIALNSELTRKSEELLAARRAADAANRAKSDFLAAMSHEIRTPLNGVIGIVDVLHQSKLMEHQVELVELIRESAHSLLGIIEDILDFSKIEAGKMKLERIPIRVGDVVERACGLVDNLAVQKEVDLTFFVDPRIPKRIFGDSLRLQQVLLNLVSNAIKFSSGRDGVRGRVAVRATVTGGSKTGAGASWLSLRVIDNGIGIDEGALSRLFLEFEQADVSTTRRFGGTGLGLAICARLVHLMEGTISVSSSVGSGATFTVTLPMRLAPDADKSFNPADDVLQGLHCMVVGGKSGLADDHADYLASAGATVERATDLATAERMTNVVDSDLVVWVLDCEGFVPAGALAATLAQLKSKVDVRVIVVAIGRGRRRKLRADADDLLILDGNVLARRRLVEAVAAAAGRPMQAGRSDAGADACLASGPAMPESEPLVEGTQLARVPGALILVVEDNEINRKVIAHQLALLGFVADIAKDGVDAIDRWRGGTYSLVLTDLQMPLCDGWGLAEAIRREERDRGEGCRVPIIALSANAAREEEKRCQAAGMDDYLPKPVEISHLARMLERWLPQVEFDLNVLAAIVGPEPDVIMEFVREFRLAADRQSRALREMCGEQKLGEVAAISHQLKSAARSIGAYPLAHACDALEAVAETEARGELSRCLQAFDACLAKLNERLDRWQSSDHRAGGVRVHEDGEPDTR